MMLLKCLSLEKELDQHNKLLPALGNDTEIINILLEHQLERQKKSNR